MKTICFHIAAQKLRFARWSRNRYGAFCSIGRQVIISSVCKSIADASLKKEMSNITEPQLQEEEFGSFYWDHGPDDDPVLLLTEQLESLLSSSVASLDAAPFVTSIIQLIPKPTQEISRYLV